MLFEIGASPGALKSALPGREAIVGPARRRNKIARKYIMALEVMSKALTGVPSPFELPLLETKFGIQLVIRVSEGWILENTIVGFSEVHSDSSNY